MARVGNLSVFDSSSDTWSLFEKRLQQFFIANSIEKEIIKKSVLITNLDNFSLKLLTDLCVPAQLEEKEFKELVDLLGNYFKPFKSIFAEREKFYCARKTCSENIMEWSTRLRGLAAECQFGEFLETVLRDKFIIGINDKRQRDLLFLEGKDLTFVRAVQLAQANEFARDAVATDTADKGDADISIKKEVEGAVYHMGRKGRHVSHHLGSRKSSGGKCSARVWEKGSAQVKCSAQCHVCGKKGHLAEICKYKNYFCNNCGKKGHLMKMCKNKINFLSEELETENICLFNLKSSNDAILLPIKINNVFFNMELDTGAGRSVMSENFYLENFQKISLDKSDLCLTGYTGEKIRAIGQFEVLLEYKGTSDRLIFSVIKNGGPPLLGRDFVSKFNLALHNLNVSNRAIEAIEDKFKAVFFRKVRDVQKS